MIVSREATRAALLLVITASGAVAQGRGGPCTLGTELSYGISALDCVQCTVRSNGTEHWTEYGTEPIVRGVFRTGNPIQPGDVLVSIDGNLITTAAGARALAHPEAGRAARFIVRRNGKTIDVTLMPGTPCPPAPPAGTATAARTDSLTAAGRDSLIREVVRNFAHLHDTIQLHYERDAFGRNYHITYRGDSADLSVPGRMLFEPDGRALLVTDSMGKQRFFQLNPGHGAPDGKRLHLTWQFGKFLGKANRLEPGRIDGDSSDAKFSQDSVHTQAADANRIEMNIATTRGWLGLALDCLRCSVDREDRSGSSHTVRFTTPPRVVAIEPGAASVAGFEVGDVIRTIDGNPMTSDAGALRFSTMRGGERVRFVVERRKDLVNLTLQVPNGP